MLLAAQADGERVHPEDLRLKLGERCKRSTYALGKIVLGFKDMSVHCHGDMAACMESPSRRKLVVIPRDHLKSTVCTITDTVRRVVANPNIRILLGNETATNASHFLRRIQAVWEKNAMFRWLYPELVVAKGDTKWSETEFLVPRTIDNPEATIEAIGVGGAVVSRHYDLLKLDDLVGKEASESDEVMKKTVDWYLYCESLLVHPTDSEIHVVGTKWAFHDIIAYILKHEDDFEHYIRSGFVYKGIDGKPCYSHQPHTGEVIGSLWPERFPPEVLFKIKKKMGSFKFSCQYDNNPSDPESSAFSPHWKKHYRWDGSMMQEVKGGVAKCDYRQTFRTLRWDPAISEDDQACNNAIVVDGVDKMGRVWVLEVWAKHCQPDIAIKGVVDLAVKWEVTSIHLESVLFQKVLKYPLAAEMERRGVWFDIKELKTDSRKSKKSRIRGVQPYFERGQVFFCESDQEQLEQEYDEFPTGALVDCLDAFAYGPQVWETWNGDDVDADEDERVWSDRRSGMDTYTGY